MIIWFVRIVSIEFVENKNLSVLLEDLGYPLDGHPIFTRSSVQEAFGFLLDELFESNVHQRAKALMTLLVVNQSSFTTKDTVLVLEKRTMSMFSMSDRTSFGARTCFLSTSVSSLELKDMPACLRQRLARAETRALMEMFFFIVGYWPGPDSLRSRMGLLPFAVLIGSWPPLTPQRAPQCSTSKFGVLNSSRDDPCYRSRD